MAKLFIPLREHILNLGLLSNECFNELLVKFNLSHSECVRAAVSKGLGLGIVAGSSLVKLPQVFKILGSGSAEGLSLLGNLLELTAITATGAYSFSQGFPFSAYGEALFLAIQTSLIALLVLVFNGRTLSALVFAIFYAAVVYAILQPGLIPAEFLWTGQAANIPMVVVGKLIQVWANLRNGHTGQLSAVTIFLLAAGSVARIFTSIQETGDQVVIMTYVATSSVNLILALQVLYYWKATKALGEKTKVAGHVQQVKDPQRKKNKPKKA